MCGPLKLWICECGPCSEKFAHPCHRLFGIVYNHHFSTVHLEAMPLLQIGIYLLPLLVGFIAIVKFGKSDFMSSKCWFCHKEYTMPIGIHCEVLVAIDD